MAGVGMLLRRWRADRGLLVVLVVVVALTAGLVGAVPRLLDRLATTSLDRAVQDTTVDRAGLVATSIQAVSTARPDAALAQLDALARDLTGGLDEDLREVLGAPALAVDSLRYDLDALPGQPEDALDRKLTVRLQPGVDEEVSLVAGAMPDGTVDGTELDRGATDAQGDPVAVHQFVATAATAEALAMQVGDRRLGVPDPSGPVMRRLALAGAPPVVVWELSGIIDLSPLEDPVWFGDPRLHRPSRFDTDQTTTIFATGLLPADAAGEFPGVESPLPASVEVRWQLDRAALLTSDLTAVQQAAVALRTAAPLNVEEPRWRTGLDRLLATEEARRATAVEVLGLGAVAVLGIALGLLVAMSAVLAVRRRDALALVRGRGASRGQLLLAGLLEFGAVVVAGGVLAQAMLLASLPRGSGYVLVVPGVAVLALVVLLAGSSRDLRRRLGALLAERRRTARTPSRHYVLDGLLVVVALVSVASLRRRGLTVDGTVDPLVVAAPVLVAAAVAVVTARLVPLPLRAVELVARRSRSLAVPLGLARAARAGQSGVMVVLVVLGLGVAGLASVIHTALVEGQARAAHERVGAAVRIDAQPLASLDPDWTPPASADGVAELRLLGRAIVLGGDRAQQVDAVVVDPAELGAVGVAEDLPPLAWDGTGAVPLLLSSDLPVVGSPQVGDDLTVLLDRQHRIAGRVVGFDPQVLGRADSVDGPFVVLDRAAAVAATGEESGVTSRLVRTDDPDAVRASALAADPQADVLVRAQVRDELRSAPLAQGVRVGYLVAAVAAVVATVVALVLSLVAAAPQRRRHAAMLSALGTSTARIRLALLAEVVPVVAGAATVGVALAGGVSLLLGERLDLAPFTGTVDQTDLDLPHWSVGVLLVAGAMLVAAVGAVMTQGRVDPGALLREGDR